MRINVENVRWSPRMILNEYKWLPNVSPNDKQSNNSSQITEHNSKLLVQNKSSNMELLVFIMSHTAHHSTQPFSANAVSVASAQLQSSRQSSTPSTSTLSHSFNTTSKLQILTNSSSLPAETYEPQSKLHQSPPLPPSSST